VQNPLDVTGAAIIDPSIFTRAIEAMAADPSVGVIGVINSLPWEDTGRPYAGQMFVDAIGAGMAAAGCPAAYINQVMQPVTAYTRQVMEHGNVPYVIPGLRQAMVALRSIGWWSDVTRGPRPEAVPAVPVTVPAAAARRGRWSEDAARRLLAGAGVPVAPARLVTSAEEATAAAADLGGPLAVKVASPDILHKSDVGGVRLGVAADEGAVRDAYQAVTAAAAAVDGARVEGVLVSPMRVGGTELLVGVVRDPQWGPALAIAFGGVFAEVLQDSVLTLLPVTPARARDLVQRLRGAALLRGARDTRPADLDAVAAVVARVGDLALALGDDLESLEVNPLHVDGTTIEALDAVVTWARKDEN
jgi:acyl-CoA synthetase (NDP forming)